MALSVQETRERRLCELRKAFTSAIIRQGNAASSYEWASIQDELCALGPQIQLLEMPIVMVIDAR